MESDYNDIYDQVVGEINYLNLAAYNLEQYRKEKTRENELDDMRNQAIIGAFRQPRHR